MWESIKALVRTGELTRQEFKNITFALRWGTTAEGEEATRMLNDKSIKWKEEIRKEGVARGESV